MKPIIGIICIVAPVVLALWPEIKKVFINIKTQTMNTQKKSACESALSRLRTSLKKAILNEEVEMTFAESIANGYYAKMRVYFGGLYFDMTIAKTFVCYHNPFAEGMFDKKADFEALTELVNKRVKFLTPEERAKIVSLQAEIDAIKKGGQA